jgi:hypothetical protein
LPARASTARPPLVCPLVGRPTQPSSHRSAGARARASLARSLAARATLACLHAGWLARRARSMRRNARWRTSLRGRRRRKS